MLYAEQYLTPKKLIRVGGPRRSGNPTLHTLPPSAQDPLGSRCADLEEGLVPPSRLSDCRESDGCRAGLRSELETEQHPRSLISPRVENKPETRLRIGDAQDQR